MTKYRYLQLPDYWSAEQAWSVMEFIYQLETLVWDAYEAQLLEFFGPDPPDPPDSDPPTDLDDDIPW
jgi:hypothetical protein